MKRRKLFFVSTLQKVLETLPYYPIHFKVVAEGPTNN